MADKKKKEQDDPEFDLDYIKKIMKKEWFIIASLFILSLAIHIIYKNAGLFHFDSAFDAIMIERSVRDWSLHYSYGWGAPGMIVIVGFFYFLDSLLTGVVSAEGAYFFVTFLTAALTSSMIYLLVKRFASRFTAVSSALLFTVTPLWLTTTTYPKTHAMAMCFSLLSVLLMLYGGEKRSWKIMAWAGAAAGTAMSIRPIDGGFILIPFAMLYAAPKLRKKQLVLDMNKMNPVLIGAFLVPCLMILGILMGPRIIEFGGIGGFLDVMGQETRGGWMGIASPQLPGSFVYLTKTITYIGWLAVAGGIAYLIKKRKLYLMASIAVWFAVFFFYIGNLAVVESRFLLPAVVPLCIMMAYGCRFAYEKNRIAGIAAVAVLVILMFATAYPIIKARHEYSGQKEFAEFVGARTEPNAVIIAGDTHVFIKIYANRQTFGFGRGKDSINDIMNNLLNRTPVYAVESSFQYMTPMEKQVLNRYFIISLVGQAQNEIYQFSALKLRRYEERLFRITLNETAVMQSQNSTAEVNAENVKDEPEGTDGTSPAQDNPESSMPSAPEVS